MTTLHCLSTTPFSSSLLLHSFTIFPPPHWTQHELQWEVEENRIHGGCQKEEEEEEEEEDKLKQRPTDGQPQWNMEQLFLFLSGSAV